MTGYQARVVQTMDSAVHRINHYPVDNSIGFASVYPLDSDLSGGQRYPSFEQLGPDVWFHRSYYFSCYKVTASNGLLVVFKLTFACSKEETSRIQCQSLILIFVVCSRQHGRMSLSLNRFDFSYLGSFSPGEAVHLVYGKSQI